MAEQHFVLWLVLSPGRRSTLTIWRLRARAWSPDSGSTCVAEAALRALTFALEAQDFDSLEIVGPRLVAAGLWLLWVARAPLYAVGAAL